MITHTWVSLHGYLSAYNSYSTFLDSDTPLMIKQQKDPGQSSWHVTGSSAQSTCSQPSKQIICFPAAPWRILPRPAASSRTLELKHRWQQGASTSEISEADWFSQCIQGLLGDWTVRMNVSTTTSSPTLSLEPMTRAQLNDSERRLKWSGTQKGLWELRELPFLGQEEVIKTSGRKT